MEYIILFLYMVGSFVAFFLLDYQNRHIERPDAPMMFIVATGSWLIVVLIGIIFLKDYIKSSIEQRNKRIADIIRNKLVFMWDDIILFNQPNKDFKHTKTKNIMDSKTDEWSAAVNTDNCPAATNTGSYTAATNTGITLPQK